MKIKIALIGILTFIFVYSCKPPSPPADAGTPVKHNYVILLDLSDRLIVQDNQTERDKEIIEYIFSLFEAKVKQELYVRSRDEIKVVIAPQKGSGLHTDEIEDRLFINMENIPNMLRRKKEQERRTIFFNTLDSLYQKAIISKDPEDYYGADIWKYFYEDLNNDLKNDSLTENFLFILTDGYPIVGKNQKKLKPVNTEFPDLKVILIEASPREKDLEWDRVVELWTAWFNEIGIDDYTFIKRRAISKEKEQIADIVGIQKNIP